MKVTRWVTCWPSWCGAEFEGQNVEVMPYIQHQEIVARHVSQETPMQAEIERLRREVRYLRRKAGISDTTGEKA